MVMRVADGSWAEYGRSMAVVAQVCLRLRINVMRLFVIRQQVHVTKWLWVFPIGTKAWLGFGARPTSGQLPIDENHACLTLPISPGHKR